MRITAEHVIKFIEGVAARIKEHRDELVQLDQPIGDSDHGVNMDRGFTTVLDKLPTVADKDIGTILKTVGMTLVSTVGGASGPLYGTAFIRAGMALADRYELTPAEVVAALEAALEGIQARGKAQRGEKTMIDAIAPGIDVLKEAQASGEDFHAAMRRSVAAVEAGMKATIPMLATKGRASYLGQRSIGHQDPGATSAFYMAQVMLETIEGIEE
ncbi:dihydroxyacetone kinase [Kouleothrix aurantiaca]|jgi:dihydroxyacetone kinase-like protein|uniref:Dihydroxyacetone kinase n=1 Tax=Kouleothrix aurantiaca TaxID=186479 RepID=A0A0N8PSK2_9CHLR|nr:dihydroxyacetone kinase [Kouleothrix aurantiaca]